ncbi:MAG: mandelate racemase/muconate lactonizing enzyme family protein [Planctomycetaceae bacterium]|nr:mandelate racemase/muconate lactonizing enzyme family protein [Planctomycetales bacterium]MCB9924392.1 mandelate racemase/muconate lactonizing enzyme family protein [Planctomycetaceae bacterium]
MSNRRDALRFGAGLLASGMLGSTPFDAFATEESELQPQLTITSVKTFLLRHTLKRPFGVSVSVPLGKTRQALLIKIETDEGLVGWGETAPISGTRGTIVDDLTPRLLGQNPLEYRRLWRELWGPNFGNGLAVGGVETALNDLRGKALNLPVAELFGGRMRDQVPVYVSALEYVEGREIEEHYPETAIKMVEQGHKAIKMRLGRYSVAREAKVAAAVRDAVGPGVQLMVDGNGGYTMANAVRMGHALNELGFEFFEEPLPQSPKYAGYDELRRKMPLPLAGGEAVDSRGSAKQLIDRRAIDIIQPDISLCGGLGEVLFISEMAKLSSIRCLPHCWGGDILIAATTHLLSLLPDPHWGLPTDTPMLELDQSENPWRDGLAIERLELEEGFIKVPTKPGLGIEVDEDVVKHYAV